MGVRTVSELIDLNSSNGGGAHGAPYLFIVRMISDKNSYAIFVML
jgi:hypothetical protein